jgi:hypothetical protein
MRQQVKLAEKTVRFSTPNNWILIKHIGDMQSTNPLRSIKELVDNSIDAFARDPSFSPKKGRIIKVEINKNGIRAHIKIVDNAVGWELDPVSGKPKFEFSVQHIGDSIKKYVKEYKKGREEGVAIGQYALGLLSFWALGDRLTIFSRCHLPKGKIGSCSKMIWKRYVETATIVDDVKPPDELAKGSGCVVIVDQLEKARMNLVTGNQLKRYLARACRSRLMKTGVTVEVYYKGKKHIVKPMKYEGISFPMKHYHVKGGFGSVELEIYLFPPRVESQEEYKVPIFAKGAKAYDDITQIEELDIYPWNAKKVYGQIDYPYGTITPSRNAFVNDAFLGAFIRAMMEITEKLNRQIEEIEARKRKRQRKKFYNAFQKTWQEILNRLPEEWLRKKEEGALEQKKTQKPERPTVKPGPMYRLEISPENAQVQCRTVQSFAAKPYDMNGNLVRDPDIIYYWQIEPSNLGQLKKDMYRSCILQAGKQEGIATLAVTAFQYVEESGKEKTIHKTASTNIWTVSKLTKKPHRPPPGDKPPLLDEIPLAEEIHSKYLPETNVVQVNNQHKDYIKAEKKGPEALFKYINYCYCKEIAVDRWKNLVTDHHELSERITDLLAISDLAFDWKELSRKPRGRPPIKERLAAWERRGLSARTY